VILADLEITRMSKKFQFFEHKEIHVTRNLTGLSSRHILPTVKTEIEVALSPRDDLLQAKATETKELLPIVEPEAEPVKLESTPPVEVLIQFDETPVPA
jgi:hypothetical protein